MSPANSISLSATDIAGQAVGSGLLLKVTVAPPPASAIAFVLDLSDSCTTMRTELERLPRLLTNTPRIWPLWLYRLSSAEPLATGELKVAHLQDNSLNLHKWVGDAVLRQRAAASGSLLRPALDAISLRRRRDAIESVKVLVLTDGELLDSASLETDGFLEVVGLTSQIDVQRLSHWRRVLPSTPLYTLGDSALGRMFRFDSHAFFGACKINIFSSDNLPVEVFRVSDNSSITAHARGNIAWNFVDGPLLLVIPDSADGLAGLRVALESAKTGATVVLEGTSAAHLTDLPALVRAALSNRVKPVVEPLLDLTTASDYFNSAWSAFSDARALAKSREPWVDSKGAVKIFTAQYFRENIWRGETTSSFDALLCLSKPGNDQSTAAESRIIILPLLRQMRPALEWLAGDKLSWGQPERSIRIEYDEMEARWMLRFDGGEAMELDPRGSQELSLAFATNDKLVLWNVLFSGPLR